MTISNAIKTIERRLGKTPIKNKYNEYAVNVNGRVLSFYKNGGGNDIVCINVRRENDHSDSMTDYSAGSFYDNLSQAIKFGLN